jgi:hypothetical protein
VADTCWQLPAFIVLKNNAKKTKNSRDLHKTDKKCKTIQNGQKMQDEKAKNIMQHRKFKSMQKKIMQNGQKTQDTTKMKDNAKRPKTVVLPQKQGNSRCNSKRMNAGEKVKTVGYFFA